ncbi:MAG: hypothetical protein JWM73_2987 [Solirubrobacterales bacterium]|nr:hypothetical protein [Solirubrobacterales bacterium]
MMKPEIEKNIVTPLPPGTTLPSPAWAMTTSVTATARIASMCA